MSNARSRELVIKIPVIPILLRSLGWISTVDSEGRTIWIADAHRGDGKRFVVQVDEKLTAFVELESAIPRLSIGEHNHQDTNRQRKESEDGAQDHGSVRPCRL
jgi:hypothetical protein